jgi:hypothetical protein
MKKYEENIEIGALKLYYIRCMYSWQQEFQMGRVCCLQFSFLYISGIFNYPWAWCYKAI